MEDEVIEMALFENITPACNMTFNNGKEVGQLYWTDGELKFEGNMDESAKLFFEFLKPYVDEYIKANRRDR